MPLDLWCRLPVEARATRADWVVWCCRVEAEWIARRPDRKRGYLAFEGVLLRTVVPTKAKGELSVARLDSQPSLRPTGYVQYVYLVNVGHRDLLRSGQRRPESLARLVDCIAKVRLKSLQVGGAW